MFKNLSFILMTCYGLNSCPVIYGSSNQNSEEESECFWEGTESEYSWGVSFCLENEGKTLRILKGATKETIDTKRNVSEDFDSIFRTVETVPCMEGAGRDPISYEERRKIDEVILPSTVQILEPSCFNSSFVPALKKVWIENPEQSQLEAIEPFAFHESKIEVLGEKLENGQYSDYLSHVTKLEEIGRCAFEKSNIKKIYLGKIRYLGDKFNDGDEGRSINFKIGEYAFSGCKNLRSFWAENYPVQSFYVNKNAFSSCPCLLNFEVNAKELILEDAAFKNDISLCEVCSDSNLEKMTIRLGRDVFKCGRDIRLPGRELLQRYP